MDGAEALHKAAEDGDLATVERLLQADPYVVFARQAYKLTPLHRAARAGHADVVAALLAHGAEADARDYGDGTALHGAAEDGRRDAAAVLLGAGADPNAKDRDGRTPLFLAARAGHEAVAAVLLAKGADPNAQGQITGAPLHQAAERGFRGIVELLLRHGALANARSGASHTPWTAWDAARRAGHGAIADLLRDHGGGDAASAAISIHRAAEHGYVGRLEALLRDDPTLIDTRDVVYRRTPLHWAAGAGHQRAAELLLAHGADPQLRDHAGDTPLDRAEAAGRPDLAELLRRAGAAG